MTGRTITRTAALCALALGAACSQAGGLGSVLGSVLGGGGGQSQLSGVFTGLDTRSQTLYVQQSNGQTVQLGYDNQTQVVYQNRNYSVTNLERGDQITARVQSTSSRSSAAYYTDLIRVDQSVTAAGSANAGAVQTFDGTVAQIDQQNGVFITNSPNGRLTVSLPYSVSRSDLSRFQSLRIGDYVRFSGVWLNNTRVELRQFY